MEFHSRCGTGISDQSWGGIPVVVFLGDDVQLPPVLDNPVYHSKSTSPASMHGVLVWQDFQTAVALKTIIRQGEQEKELKDVLSNLRQYKVTPPQAIWLQQFQWNNLQKMNPFPPNWHVYLLFKPGASIERLSHEAQLLIQSSSDKTAPYHVVFMGGICNLT